MGSFLRSVLKNNVFSVKLEVSFENNSNDPMDRLEVQAKIDTGCFDTFISYDALFVILSDDELLKAKEKWLKHRKFGIGYGVETKSGSIQYPRTLKEAIDNENVYIRNRYYNIKINEVNIGNRLLNTSYDRNDKILLGMGIFKDWDFHVGKNSKGETVFIGCPLNQLNQDYYLALEKEFGISTKLNAAIISNSINNNNQI